MAIERAFGVLKARYPALEKPLPYSVTVQGLLLPALCALHNFIRRFNDPAVEAKLIHDVGISLSRQQAHDISGYYPAARKDVYSPAGRSQRNQPDDPEDVEHDSGSEEDNDAEDEMELVDDTNPLGPKNGESDYGPRD